MRRREFIAGLGSAAAWPLVARAQQSQRMRRIGVLMNYADDPESATLVAAITQGLVGLGWRAGRCHADVGPICHATANRA
jgi:putative ABC transport system substrate-binding protein